MKPSIYPHEIRQKLVENKVCLAENTPSNASVAEYCAMILDIRKYLLKPTGQISKKSLIDILQKYALSTLTDYTFFMKARLS